MNPSIRLIFTAALFSAVALPASAFDPRAPECVAPANPGGGFDLTCRIASESFRATGQIGKPVGVRFMPGGVGALAFDHVTTDGRSDRDSIYAFSSGSVLNIVRGEFGQGSTENDVRWLASAGADFGAIVVRSDSPWRNLHQLMEAISEDPSQFTVGAAGAPGGQDWMKAALLMQEAGANPRLMNYREYEGGGSAIGALLRGEIDFYPGDVSELKNEVESETLRILAVLSTERLPGEFSRIPTAIEQGYDVEWTIYRGYYLGPDASDESYAWWTSQFRRLQSTPEFARIRDDRGLFPFSMAGQEFDRYVKDRAEELRSLARAAGLI